MVCVGFEPNSSKLKSKYQPSDFRKTGARRFLNQSKATQFGFGECHWIVWRSDVAEMPMLTMGRIFSLLKLD